MCKLLDYTPDFDNPESLIVYKFCLAPHLVINEDCYNSSYRHLIMNNEFIKLIGTELYKEKIYYFMTIDMLNIIKKLVKESIDFYDSYDERAQAFSKKDKKIKVKGAINKLIHAKYKCFKEAYDLELPLEKINNFDIISARKTLDSINSILKPGFDVTISSNFRKIILELLNDDIKSGVISSTLEINPYELLINLSYFRALICSNELLNKIDILLNNNQLSEQSVDVCIFLLSNSISAATKTLNSSLCFVVDEQDIKDYNIKEALSIKNKLVCLKYKNESKAIKQKLPY